MKKKRVELITVDLLTYQEIMRRLVAEGRRIGKVPWCADAYAEDAAARKLRKHGVRERETMVETVERRG